MSQPSINSDEPSVEQSHAFATSLFQGAQLVSQYMKGRFGLIEGVIVKSETGYREACIKGLWMRAYAWMHTIEKLSHPLDFQAISAGNRALLEITVDLILLHSDKTNASGWKMHWWGESEKLRASEQVIKFYTDQGLLVPDEYEGQMTFCRESTASINHMRKALWPIKADPSIAKHPKRWTGTGNLFEDIKKADEYYGRLPQSDLGCTLTEYYRTEYPKMNWRIHSGAASFWNQPPQSYELVSGFALKGCADLSMLCTKIILLDFGFDSVLTGLNAEWDIIKNQRDLLVFQELQKVNGLS